MTIRITPSSTARGGRRSALIGVGVGGFFIGRSSVRVPSAEVPYLAGYHTGYAAGNAAGRSQGRVDGYKSGYDAGSKKAAGGVPSAIDNAYSQGANRVFSGFTTPLKIGSYYIMPIAPGQPVGHGYSTNYGVDTSVEMMPGQAYNLCTHSAGTCVSPYTGP